MSFSNPAASSTEERTLVMVTMFRYSSPLQNLTFTYQGSIKKGNRHSEILLRDLEVCSAKSPCVRYSLDVYSMSLHWRLSSKPLNIVIRRQKLTSAGRKFYSINVSTCLFPAPELY